MTDAAVSALAAQRCTWQQTMLRVKDPKKSVAFYQEHFGMTLIDKIEFPQYKFDLYFMTTIPKGESFSATPGSDEAHKNLWTMDGTTLELTHNYGTEDDADFKHHPGNAEKDGFGHIAFNTADVYAASAKLEAAGVAFKKKPDDGRMKGLAFVYDPDGYWVEIVKRADDSKIENEYNLSQARPPPLPISRGYDNHTTSNPNLGMTLCREVHLSDFSLYFLATLPAGISAPDPKGEQAAPFVKNLFGPVLELTHNHGTENDAAFQHLKQEGKTGFGHIGFLCEDVSGTCDALETLGATFHKKPLAGNMKGLAFVNDPDGYRIEIVKRGGYDAKATPYYFEQ
ncbi:Glyoxalase/Bleomycin resistance protein/Dihydroxybiphenyl dioxygenase [Baffinella frigidus]|nr:Glyoxalase/Bleomycin resistance protein/Dihydroxybiphenyl dioxygenase [Cryptophyta sp. CCMP2293]